MIVSLYIKVQEQYDPSLVLVVDRFEQRVEDDGGIFEAGNCLKKTIESLGGVYGIGLNKVVDFQESVLNDGGTFEAQNCLLKTINSLGGSAPAPAFRNVAKRIELFEDEKISLTSSIQNISDISKVFTDYTQSFTIPASDNNNQIFRHWYENSLDNGFDQRQRYEGYIEIDTQTFRVGKWQLESASVKNNRIENYKITFYGELKSLTDKFVEDKLKDIQQINDYSIVYNGANVQNAITSTFNPNLTFPLISSERVWQYGSGSENIGNSSHRIHYTELFPALKIARIFDAIESKYGVSFNGDFLNQTRFTQAYLWLKNSESKVLIPKTEKKLIQLTDESSNDFFLIENDTLNVLGFSSPTATDAKFKILVTFTAATNSTLYVYKDDVLYTSINGGGTSIFFDVDSILLPGSYKFYIQTQLPTTYTATSSATYFDLNTLTTVSLFSNSISSATLDELDLTVIVPDMKVTDFFSGILKMFNLTAFSTDGVNFTLEQLENWYYQGSIKDFSEYTTTDLDFERIKPYKKINFEYEKSENVLSRNFFETNAREYGNLSYPFNTDGGDYTIKLPFENLMFNKFTGTNLQVGYALKSDFTPYAPKPVILYLYQNASCNFYLNNGTTTVNITNYNVMGQDVIYESQNNSLNWGVEISSYLLQTINNSLFNNYYLAYLNNLYLLKSRMLKVSMRLPYLELLNLKLNDRIVIRDKRYIINSYTTDLTTFESNFELIQDFRSVNFNNSTLRQTDNTSKLITINTTSVTPLTWSIESDTEDFIALINNEDTYVEIGVKTNASGVERNAVLVSNLNDKIIIRQDA